MQDVNEKLHSSFLATPTRLILPVIVVGVLPTIVNNESTETALLIYSPYQLYSKRSTEFTQQRFLILTFIMNFQHTFNMTFNPLAVVGALKRHAWCTLSKLKFLLLGQSLV